MQSLNKIIEQNREAVERFQNSENEQLAAIAEQSEETLKVIDPKERAE